MHCESCICNGKLCFSIVLFVAIQFALKRCAQLITCFSVCISRNNSDQLQSKIFLNSYLYMKRSASYFLMKVLVLMISCTLEKNIFYLVYNQPVPYQEL